MEDICCCLESNKSGDIHQREDRYGTYGGVVKYFPQMSTLLFTYQVATKIADLECKTPKINIISRTTS
jgi:hypothetical protein